ncbi:RpiB/LacA/LacB family sugar-phosphate isomerase [Candidatus Nomurabacteria bacterium]|nr:RpiB/LacA/LacB family sugar-phosphate isomerase [Candidatus Nomurabacteria bacterium]
MKIVIGTDHAGYVLKEKLMVSLKARGYEVVDKGAYKYDEHDDYTDFIIPVAEEISKDPNNMKGIVLGATGQGEAIAANRFVNVRAIVYYGEVKSVVDDEANMIVRSREHNNSNVLSLGARFLTEEDMMSAVNLWLNTPYIGLERHARRLEKIEKISIKK